MKICHAFLGLLVGSLLIPTAWSVTAADLARLGQDLTATGAEKAGNKDGTIPTFGGNENPLPGWSYGKLREDYWKYKGEKPIFEIDASNVDKYADKLSPGQIQMLKQLKGYTMPVYQTHRNCSVPDFVEQYTKEGASKSSISKSDGWSLENASLPGVPFPIPTSGIEVMWNWLTHYQGLGIEWPKGWTLVSPRPGSTKGIYVSFNQMQYFPWAMPGRHTPQESSGLQNGFYYAYKEPVSLSGQALVQRYYFAKPTDSFYYFTGQRRVRRLPAYAYDAPLIGFENQYPADSSFGFIGNPDRFDWKIVGKKEMYVPYNGFATQRFNTRLDEALEPHYVNPKMRRYELHRVWEIEGTVKAGLRHSTPKKVLFIGEDAWLLLVTDEYDAQGKLWRSKENYPTPEWEIGACGISAETYNDLIGERYIFDQNVVDSGADMKFFPPETKDPRFTDGFYTGENLGAISER